MGQMTLILVLLIPSDWKSHEMRYTDICEQHDKKIVSCAGIFCRRLENID